MATAERIEVKLPDGSALELDAGATGADAAAAIGSGLAKAALAVKVDGELRDLSAPLSGGESIEIVTDRSPEALELIRHDAAHVLAESVLDLWPDAKISIGPPIEHGFYYDIEFPDGAPGEDDLGRIEKQMAEHVKADEPFERRELPSREAIEYFRDQGQDYKVELIEDLIRDEGAETVSLYRNGPFEDLCRGPHGPSTGRIGAFKLTSIAGAYWRGDETRQMLTRIYGTAFLDEKDLKRHLERIDQAKENDHRRLGRATTAAWAPSSTSSCCARRPPGCPSGSPTEPCSWPTSRPSCRSSCAGAATSRSRPRACSTRSSAIAPGTGTTTARTCSSPSPPSATATTPTGATRSGR